MFKQMWQWILTNVFKISSQTQTKDVEENARYSLEYKRIDEINFNAIISNKLANYVMSDSSLTIEGDNDRSKYLNDITKSLWRKGKKIVGMSFGTGGVFLIPYVKGKDLLYNIVEQDRVTIDEMLGDKIKGATVFSERRVVTIKGNKKEYFRWTNYSIQNDAIRISQKYTNENGEIIPIPEFWKDIDQETIITGVDKVLIGYIKSPVNNRSTNDMYGVPITYGCESTIKEIKDCLKQIVREFSIKKAFLGVDYTLFNGRDGKQILNDDGLYRKFNGDKDDMWQLFDPAIRESSYYARLQELYIRLEHEIGLSAGVLSDPKTQNATATEIKKMMYDTFTLCDDMRTLFELGVEDFIDACNIYSNAFNLSPMGEYEVNYDWSYSLIEDTQAEFNQLLQGMNKGVVSKLELRQWMHPEEDIEESKKAIEEIKASEPSMKDLLGESDE